MPRDVTQYFDPYYFFSESTAINLQSGPSHLDRIEPMADRHDEEQLARETGLCRGGVATWRPWMLEKMTLQVSKSARNP